MIKPYHLLLTILLTSGIWSCAPKVINQSTTKERDSLAVKTVHFKDTVRIRKDSVSVTLQEFLEKLKPISSISPDSLKKLNLTTAILFDEKEGRAELKVTRSAQGKVDVKCKCDSAQIIKDYALKDTTHYKTKVITNTRTIIKPVTSGFDKFCRWFFIACCCVASVIFAFKFKSIFL